MRPAAAAAAIALAGALVPTIAALSIASDNNNQGEIYDTLTGAWRLDHVLELSAIFYLPSFLILFLLAWATLYVWRGGAP